MQQNVPLQNAVAIWCFTYEKDYVPQDQVISLSFYHHLYYVSSLSPYIYGRFCAYLLPFLIVFIPFVVTSFFDLGLISAM